MFEEDVEALECELQALLALRLTAMVDVWARRAPKIKSWSYGPRICDSSTRTRLF